MASSSYKSKKETEEGNVVYEYSDKHIKKRNKEKAKKVERLSNSIEDLRKKYEKDLKSEDPKIRTVALATALMDETFERIGNQTSEEERGHFGVTGWRKKHFKFNGNKATISYTGKSGVKQEKTIENKKVVKMLKELAKDKKKEDPLLTYCVDEDVCRVKAYEVNDYLKDFEITAKDLRGYHANEEMSKTLKDLRKKGKKLPSDKKEKEKVLKEEFKEALDTVAEQLGHTKSTLKNQYLVPNFEEHYLEKGKPMKTYHKKSHKKMASRVAIRRMKESRGSDLNEIGLMVDNLLRKVERLSLADSRLERKIRDLARELDSAIYEAQQG